MAKTELEELLSKYKLTMPAVALSVYSPAVCLCHIVLNAAVEREIGAEKKKAVDKVVQNRRSEIRKEIMKRARDIEKDFEKKGNKTIQGHYAALIMATLFFTHVVTKKYPKLFEQILSAGARISTRAKEVQQGGSK